MSDLTITTPEQAAACKTVLEWIDSFDVGLFKGRYDATHGSEKYMHGISTMIDLLESGAGFLDETPYTDKFFENMKESETRAEKRKREMAGE